MQNKNDYITMLGTGNAHATRCYNTCFTLHGEKGVLLVDAGGGNGILTQLEKAGIRPFLYRLLGKKRLYKLIAKGEYAAAVGYEHLIADFPDVESVKNDEKRHGDIVSGLID